MVSDTLFCETDMVVVPDRPIGARIGVIREVPWNKGCCRGSANH